MIIYPNNTSLNFEIEDMNDLEIYYQPYIYTSNGIYTKYKKHYYKLSDNNVFIDFNYNNINFLAQKYSNKIDKNSLLTSIPYDCYYVNKKIIKCQLNENLCVIKEIDNDVNDSIYFLNNDIDINEDNINIICSYLK